MLVQDENLAKDILECSLIINLYDIKKLIKQYLKLTFIIDELYFGKS